jgi:P27 family predicted phage terminase small subunit
MSGPPPKYTPKERALQGNSNNAKRIDVEPATQLPNTLTDVPPAPDLIAGPGDINALAMHVWSELAPILINSRVLREGDEISLARYCRYLGEWADCTHDIDVHGIKIQTPRGIQRNPAFLARQQLEANLHALENELGLSPKARTEVQRRIMRALRDEPLVGRQAEGDKGEGPIGFLNADD